MSSQPAARQPEIAALPRAQRMTTEDRIQALMEPFAQEEIETRQGARGKMLPYIAGENVIRRLIRACPEGFDFTIKSYTRHDYPARLVKDTGEYVDRELWVATVTVTIPGLGSRDGVGVQVVDQGTSEDMIKGAATDALKKAATVFGVGLELYDDPKPQQRPEQSNQPGPVAMITKDQLDRLARLKAQKGATDDGIKKLHGKPSASRLTQAEAAELIKTLEGFPDVDLTR